MNLFKRPPTQNCYYFHLQTKHLSGEADIAWNGEKVNVDVLGFLTVLQLVSSPPRCWDVGTLSIIVHIIDKWKCYYLTDNEWNFTI